MTIAASAVKQRMNNPATVIPGALKAIQDLIAAADASGLSLHVKELAHLRASQINGCSFCVDYGSRNAKKAGETDERLFAVAAWRDATCFDDQERAALALAEAVTRLSDREDPVPDELWDEVQSRFDERELSGLLLAIAITNVFNRLNVPIRQIPGVLG